MFLIDIKQISSINNETSYGLVEAGPVLRSPINNAFLCQKVRLTIKNMER